MTDIAKTTFIFLRHGEPVGGKIFRGSTNDPLTELGWKQLNDSVIDLSFDEIVSSPLTRCLAFAKELKTNLNIPLQIIDDFQEMHLGEWEGLSVEQVDKLDSNALGKFWSEPHKNPPPKGEAFNDFETRVLSSWSQLNEQYTDKEQSKTVLVVCHAGVMMVLLKSFLKISMDNILCIKLNYASKVRVEVYDASYNLKPQIYIDHGYEF